MNMEKFVQEFSVPHFLTVFGPKFANNLYTDTQPERKHFTTSSATHLLECSYAEVHPNPLCRTNEHSSTILIGSPIIRERIACQETLEKFAHMDDINYDFIRELDGEFTIFHFDYRTSALYIINDRFTSYPVYYRVDEKLKSIVASPFFSDIWHYLQEHGTLKINEESFFEFLWFQRVLGEKTHLRDVSFLPAASVLKFCDGKTEITAYWQRNYEKSRFNLKHHAYQLADLIKRSVKSKTSDAKRYGHFLSGGMDSRSVLCAFPDDSELIPQCFTAAISENRELRTARKIARTKGAKHIALQLDEEHYGRILKHSVRVVSAMYNYDNGLFYGFNRVVRERIDVSFHGHGFDYMFQGMYIPGRNVVVKGRTLYLRSIRQLPEDLVGYFIDNASYRTKRADIWKYIKPERIDGLREFQHESVREILERGRELTENPYDLVEYLTFHHISRHYSYPNHASIATYVEQRTVSFFNALFDFYLALPIEQRFNGRIEKETLKILNPAIAAIWSANTNLPVTASPWTQTAYQLAGFIKRRIFTEEQKPEWQERTWPGRDDAVRQQQRLKDALQQIFDSEVLDQLNFIDTDRMKDDFTRWVNGENIPGPSGDFVQVILSAGTFLQQEKD